MTSRLLIVCAVASMVAGCSRAPVVTLENRASLTLSNITISGAGFTNYLESIAPGQSRKLELQPSGESGLRVSWDAGSKHMDVEDFGYIERNGGYRVVVTIQPDLKAIIRSEVKPWF